MLPRPHESLGPGKSVGLRAGGSQIGHLLRRRPVIAGARGVELDGVEQVTAQHNHTGEITRPGPRFNAADELSHGETQLSARPLKRVPEPAAQRVPYLVMQEGVDRQRRILKQPGLQVRWHARLAGKDSLQP